MPDTTWLCKRYATTSGEVIQQIELQTDEAGYLILPLEQVEPDAVYRLSLIEHEEAPHSAP